MLLTVLYTTKLYKKTSSISLVFTRCGGPSVLLTPLYGPTSTLKLINYFLPPGEWRLIPKFQESLPVTI